MGDWHRSVTCVHMMRVWPRSVCNVSSCGCLYALRHPTPITTTRGRVARKTAALSAPEGDPSRAP